MLGASATTSTPAEPPSTPTTSQGRRRPNRDVVRSLSRPNTGLPTMATRAPVPATSDRLAGARSLPTSATTLSANVTSSGEMSSRMADTYAAAYQAMKPQPTRSGTAGWDAAIGTPLDSRRHYGTMGHLTPRAGVP